ncbi:MAG: diguanylate cyclase [Thermoguttaceae bacterium]|jgi:diguanylate cyclase (GGDEF)-like protein/PAS domain S-box-containing protein/putative nucleotidyltransferase with HDIG domain
MKLPGAKTRVAFGLACVTACVILTAMTLGLIPDRSQIAVNDRMALCKTIGLQAAMLVSQGNHDGAVQLLQLYLASRSDILSAGIRRKDGKLWVEAGDHGHGWNLPSSVDSTDDQIKIPFIGIRHNWGHLEVRFVALKKPGIVGTLLSPTCRSITFVTVSCFLLNLLFLSRILKCLDPSQAVPSRVRSALNVLTEGLLVLDQKERIMLANSALEDILGVSSLKLQGQPVSSLPWEGRSSSDNEFPWSAALREGNPQTGAILRLQTHEGDYRTFVVNAAPVRSPANSILGLVVCLEDVTPLERERDALNNTLVQLEHSREEIRKQNEELRILATIDPLTGCLNRRSFFEQFEIHWKTNQRYGHPVSCIMIDIDHFKNVNDKWGHSIGDDVLRGVAATLQKTMRECDLICRYGGEEFCIALPHIDIDSAFVAAERFRKTIMAAEFKGVQIAVSLGISSSTLGATEPQDLLQQADKSLYLAKYNGRNQTVRWDQADQYKAIDQSSITHTSPLPETVNAAAAIPFHAVSALLSTLTYRDPSTAEHSIRVADICVLMASGKMPATDVYLLETAALLHDIGKIGVPDAILLKPGPLNTDEWKVINAHERIGVEIIRFAFANEELAEMVMHHHTWYDGNPSRPDLIKGKDCPLSTRILTIADAYDTMISDRIYRKAHSREEAFAELRRCAGTQFDPLLVEEFIAHFSDLHKQESNQLSHISYETAVSIGQTIESLAYALDKHQGSDLASLAGRLKITAAEKDLPHIKAAAERLETAVVHDADLEKLAEITQELFDLCRTVQRAYIQPLICTSKK